MEKRGQIGDLFSKLIPVTIVAILGLWAVGKYLGWWFSLADMIKLPFVTITDLFTKYIGYIAGIILKIVILFIIIFLIYIFIKLLINHRKKSTNRNMKFSKVAIQHKSKKQRIREEAYLLSKAKAENISREKKRKEEENRLQRLKRQKEISERKKLKEKIKRNNIFNRKREQKRKEYYNLALNIWEKVIKEYKGSLKHLDLKHLEDVNKQKIIEMLGKESPTSIENKYKKGIIDLRLPVLSKSKNHSYNSIIRFLREEYSGNEITTRNEHEFQKSLFQALKGKFGNRFDIKNQYKIKGRKVDLVIDNMVGIELKLSSDIGNLKKAPEQILAYKNEFQIVWLVIMTFGNTKKIEDLIDRCEKLGAEIIIVEGRKGK